MRNEKKLSQMDLAVVASRDWVGLDISGWVKVQSTLLVSGWGDE